MDFKLRWRVRRQCHRWGERPQRVQIANCKLPRTTRGILPSSASFSAAGQGRAAVHGLALFSVTCHSGSHALDKPRVFVRKRADMGWNEQLRRRGTVEWIREEKARRAAALERAAQEEDGGGVGSGVAIDWKEDARVRREEARARSSSAWGCWTPPRRRSPPPPSSSARRGAPQAPQWTRLDAFWRNLFAASSGEFTLKPRRAVLACAGLCCAYARHTLNCCVSDRTRGCGATGDHLVVLKGGHEGIGHTRGPVLDRAAASGSFVCGVRSRVEPAGALAGPRSRPVLHRECPLLRLARALARHPGVPHRARPARAVLPARCPCCLCQPRRPCRR